MESDVYIGITLSNSEHSLNWIMKEVSYICYQSLYHPFVSVCLPWEDEEEKQEEEEEECATVSQTDMIHILYWHFLEKFVTSIIIVMCMNVYRQVLHW
jgi:uncharacterized membrane protein (DUF106 family)